MKKSLVAATVAAFGLCGVANAADVYSPAGLKDVPYVAVPTWTGFYIGAHVGGAWADLQTTDVAGWWSPAGSQWNNTATGVIGGGQLGYNYQTGAFVFGVEADFGGLGISHRQSPYARPDLYYSNVDSGFYADVTGRLGYAAGPALFYVKGGWAFFDGGLNVTDGTVAPAVSVTKTGVDGWTVGGGIEYKISPSWGVKGEYRYFDFGNTSVDLTGLGDTFQHQLTVNTVTVGVNYYVGNVYSPLK